MCLRSAISYNTDLWAASSAISNNYPIGGAAGLKPEDDTTGVLDTICEDLRKIGPEAEIKGRVCMTQAGMSGIHIVCHLIISISQKVVFLEQRAMRKYLDSE